MFNGGYKIIDLKDKNLSSTPVTIAGVFNALKDSYRKPILITGLTIANVKLNDEFGSTLTVGASSATIKVASKTITVASNDAVTIA